MDNIRLKQIAAAGYFLAPLLQLACIAMMLIAIDLLSHRLSEDEAIIQKLTQNQILTAHVVGAMR